MDKTTESTIVEEIDALRKDVNEIRHSLHYRGFDAFQQRIQIRDLETAVNGMRKEIPKLRLIFIYLLTIYLITISSKKFSTLV